MTRHAAPRWRWLPLVGILCLGFMLRIVHLDREPLRGDEAFAASYWAGLPLSESLTRIATLEPHPPLTYGLFRAWGLVVGTDSTLALRMLPALTNLLGVALVYALGVRLHGHRMGLVAALLWAINPFEVWHARDLRNYAPWASASALAAYAGLVALQRPSRARFVRYSGIMIATGLLFYFELLYSAAWALIGLLYLRHAPRWGAAWAALHALALVIVGGVFMLLQGVLFWRGGYAGNVAHADPASLLMLFPGVLIAGDTLDSALLPVASLLVLATVAAGIAQHHRDTRALLLLWIVVPALLLLLISLRVAVFAPRYILPTAAPLMLALSVLVVHLPRLTRPLRALAAASAAALLSLSAASLLMLYSDAYQKSPDWYAIRDYLRLAAAPADIVVQTTVDAAFGFYVEPLLKTMAIPSTPAQTLADVDALLRPALEQGTSIWLFEHSLYPWENARLARTWLDAYMHAAYETRVMGVPLVLYLPRSRQPWEQTGVSASFGDVRLSHARLQAAGDVVVAWLHWDGLTGTALARSIQVIGPWNAAAGSPLWLQSDVAAAQVNAARDVHRFDVSSLPPGQYAVIVKLYDPATGAVVRVASADFVPIGSFVR